MKLNAWAERGTARDLCDLFALSQIGAITGDAVRIAAQASRPIQRHAFDERRLPTQAEWSAALGHQMQEPPDREEAFNTVAGAVARSTGWDDPG